MSDLLGRPRLFWVLCLPWRVLPANRGVDLMQTGKDVPTPRQLRLIRKWESLWGLSGLTTVCFDLSPRLKTSLARCSPAERSVRLNPALLEASNRKLLPEVLCHELAHIAVYESNGRRPRPHGPEWQSLVRAAGFEPKTRLALNTPGTWERVRPSPKFEHRCPICQAVRYSTRRIRTWRCETCHRDGLPGELIITRL